MLRDVRGAARSIAFGTALFGVLVLAPRVTSAAEKTTTPFKGATHIHRTATSVGGAVQDYHIVIVDLKEPTLRVAVSPQIDRNKTTSTIGKKHKAKLAINGSFFSYADREPCGATQASSAFWTNAYVGCSVTIAFGPTGQATIVGTNTTASLPASASFAKEAISGKPWMLKSGQSTAPWSDPSHIDQRNPRTAVGLTAGGAKLVVLVADGRRTGAAGMVGSDMVSVMKDLGAVDALNLDGGGSTTLWIPSENGVVNEPSDGSERAVANAVMVLEATPPAKDPDAGESSGGGAGGQSESPANGGAGPNDDGTGATGAGDPSGPPTSASDDGEGCAAAPIGQPHRSTDRIATAIAIALLVTVVVARRNRVRCSAARSALGLRTLASPLDAKQLAAMRGRLCRE